MSGQKKAGRKPGSVPSNKYPSQLQGWIGRESNSLMVTSETVIRVGEKNRPYLMTMCKECGKKEQKAVDTIKSKMAGCRKCGRKRNSAKPCLGVPKWLLMRCISAKDRCTNRNSKSWKSYGGRGITFEFDSPSLMGVYLMENFSITRDQEIDRINNDQGYAPGNIRAVSVKVNANNKRGKGGTRRMHKFRMMYPHVNYADSTLARLLTTMTFAEAIARFNKKSCKPKGVYGISSIADPEIASLAKDC
jgi:hypothetical protein